ncbi:MAG: chromate transporter [Geminicoccaceae bacterium]
MWLTPIGLLWLTLGGDHVFVEIGLFFSKLAVVTFGGAYAVLAYMAQAAVETHGWLSGPEMLDGLGLAETTPGPLILVTEFVGFLAAARADGDTSLAMGLAGAILTLWVTFAPCFLWIFAGAPYLGRIAASPKLAGALQGVTAAVVGVILNLSLWFTIQVLVPGSEERWLGFIRYWTLPPSGVDLWATALAAISAAALLWARIGMIKTLGLAAGLGLLLHVTGLIGA